MLLERMFWSKKEYKSLNFIVRQKYKTNNAIRYWPGVKNKS